MKKYILVILICLLIFSFFGCDGDDDNNPPSVTISASPTTGVRPLTVSFTATASDPDGDLISYLWHFGDSSGSSMEQNPVYVYTTGGTFTATCEVSDNGSPKKSATATTVISVLANYPVPVLSSIDPGSNVYNMPAFTLIVKGTGLYTTSKIVFNTNEKETNYVNETELNCTIQPEDITPDLTDVAGYLPEAVSDMNLPVIIRNPAPGGGDSGSKDFVLKSNYTFPTPSSIDKTLFTASTPKIAMDSAGNLYVVWLDDSQTSSWEIYFSKSTDHGATWSSPVNISGTSSGTFPPNIWERLILKVGSNDSLHLFWNDEQPGNYEVYYMRSTDGGTTWTNPKNISKNSGESRAIDAAIDSNGYIHIIWYDNSSGSYKVLYSRSANNGETFGKPMILGTQYQQSTDAAIAIGKNDAVYAAWAGASTTGGPVKLAYSRSTTGGTVWSIRTEVPNSTADSIVRPIIFDDSSGNIYIIWHSITSTSAAILFTKSTNGGGSWSQPYTLHTYNYPLYYSSWADIDGRGNINCLYYELNSKNIFNIFTIRSFDQGANWSSPSNLYVSSQPVRAPYFIFDANLKIYAVMVIDTPNIQSSSADKLVYFSKSNE